MSTATPISVITARNVPLSALWIEAPHWNNPRQDSGLSDADIASMGASIKAKGIIDPLKVQRILVNGEVRDLVIDGQRRVRGAKEVLPKHYPIPVVDIEEEPIELTPEKGDELMLKALTTLEREGLSSFELSAVAERMKARGKTGEHIAAAIGKSASWVSKILKARSTAAPRLMLDWRKGKITDEQFKELAEVKGEAEQAEAAREVVDARKSGDKAEARVRAKEIKETARAAVKPNGTTGHVNGAHRPPPVVAGPQLDLLDKDKGGRGGADAKKPAPPKMTSRAALEDLVGMAERRPPVADYVKGIVDCARYALGTLDPTKFAKSWHQYLARIEGRPRPARKVKVKAKAARPVKKAKARKPAKAKTSTGKRKR